MSTPHPPGDPPPPSALVELPTHSVISAFSDDLSIGCSLYIKTFRAMGNIEAPNPRPDPTAFPARVAYIRAPSLTTGEPEPWMVISIPFVHDWSASHEAELARYEPTLLSTNWLLRPMAITLMPRRKQHNGDPLSELDGPPPLNHIQGHWTQDHTRQMCEVLGASDPTDVACSWFFKLWRPRAIEASIRITPSHTLQHFLRL